MYQCNRGEHFWGEDYSGPQSTKCLCGERFRVLMGEQRFREYGVSDREKFAHDAEAEDAASAEVMRRDCIRVTEEWADEPCTLEAPTPVERMKALPLPGAEALDALLREARRQGAEAMRGAAAATAESPRDGHERIASRIRALPLPEEAP